MRVLVTGGAGVLGRATLPLLKAAGHETTAPDREGLDLFDPRSIREVLTGAHALLHLASRIPARSRMNDPEAWIENDRMRADASRLLVDAALAAGTRTYVQPTVAFMYPAGPADESTPIHEVPERYRSALTAEAEAARFTAGGRRGVVLRLGLLYGPTTESDDPDDRYGATLHIEDAARALVAALDLPSGIYNVVEDCNRVSNRRFVAAAAWRPRR
jgi:nucleoside-diphosphate-sugar epimerase